MLVLLSTSLPPFHQFFFLGTFYGLPIVVDPVTVAGVAALRTYGRQRTSLLSRPDFQIVHANVLHESLCDSNPFT